MFLRLLLLFTLVPLAELYLLLQIGRWVGPLPTLALVLATGALGAWLARGQGVAAWQRVQNEINQGRLPGEALLDGALVLVAGAVLLTPGLLTDLFGFALLVPMSRRFIRQLIVRRFRQRLDRPRQPTGDRPRVIVIDDSREEG